MKKKTAVIFLLLTIIILTLTACETASRLSFAKDTITVEVDTVFMPEIKIYPKKASYNLKVENETIARVTDGQIKALKEGKTTITVSSGKKFASCELLVVKKGSGISTDPIIKETRTVSFQIVNYADYGFETGALEPVVAVDGSYINVNEPNVFGYIVDCWYLDADCTVKFDMERTRITQDITLYAKISPREQSYNVINGLVVGILYKNLPHEKLVLPEKTEGGETITGIADNAFFGDEELKEVVIPASYLTIGDSAFAGCKNLTTVTFENESGLLNVGVNAFGVHRDDNGNIDGYCGNLESMNLPRTVTDIGAFAFYKCEKLVINDIPSGITQIPLYAFAETKINNVDLSNVKIIREGAFNNCKELDTVTNASNVVTCEKYAFDGTKLATDADKAYRTDRKEPAFYADTILFGVCSDYGKGLGDGKYKIKDTTTLIADMAFAGEEQSELTLYIDTEIADGILAANTNFLGDNVFYKTTSGYPAGVFIVVSEGKTELYRNKYTDYKDLFAEEEKVEVLGDENVEQNNYGTHILLRKDYANAYYYDKYIADEKGSPRYIKIGTLAKKKEYPIVRINMKAIQSISELRNLELHNVRSIAHWAISQCPQLDNIDISMNNLTITKLEDAESIQLSTCKTKRENGEIIYMLKIYVAASSYTRYRSDWSEFEKLCAKLTAK